MSTKEQAHTATPGPWTAKWSMYREGTFIVQAGMPSNRVLASFDGDGDGPDDQDLANARLIAAAPDLLAALRGLMPSNVGALPSTMPDGATLPLDVTFGELRRAMAAIDKATGASR